MVNNISHLPNFNKHIIYIIIVNLSIQIFGINRVGLSLTVFAAVKLDKTSQWPGFISNIEYNMNS